MNKQRIGLRLIAEVICVICLGHETARAALTPSNYAVQINAQANESPARIDLHWIVDGDAKSYTIKKKLPTEKEWVQMSQVGGNTSSYSDSQVTIGSTVEYQIIKETDNGYTGYGYIYAGIKKPLVEQRGRIILVVESSLTEPLKTEIDRLASDLVGENWRVSRITVSQNDSVSSVKSKIKAIYDSDAGNTKAVLLLGHVPVPYSGDIEPDEHDNHRGAWPADVYYGDLDGTWTDNSVNRTSAERSINWNVPGDGKFDQSYIPSAVELQVGRVDFWWMTCFSNKTPSRSEIDLTRQYLDKNHNFRQGYVVPARTGLLLDQFGLRYPEPLAAMSWRNLSALVGSENITATTELLFPRVSDQSFLFGFVSGGGSWTYSTAVGTSDQFAINPVNIVFTSFIGSYFGDWNNESNFMRAVLGASGMTLTSCYGGKPPWFMHPMAMGYTIGDCLKITEENGTDGPYLPVDPGTAQTHISLLGDPSLRAFIVPPPRNVTATKTDSGMRLSWNESNTEALQGYVVGKSTSPSGPYIRISNEYIQGTSFTDPAGTEGGYYMVKAVNLTTTPSGSFYNDSIGVFYPSSGDDYRQVPTAPYLNRARVNGTYSVVVDWERSDGDVSGYSIERRNPGVTTYSEIARVNADQFSFEDTNLPATGTLFYRVRAWNSDGASDYSNIAMCVRERGAGEFVRYDFETSGNWQGKYGTAGYAMARHNYDLPQNVSVALSNLVDYAGSFMNDNRLPPLPKDTARITSSWAANQTGDIDLQFDDNAAHQVSLYTIDWQPGGRVFNCKMFDAITGALLDDRTITGHTNGVYLTYNVRHRVLFHISPTSDALNNAVFGLYIDPAVVISPEISPGSGVFLAKANLNLTSSTPGAEIRYSLDGSAPDHSSPLYNGPLTLLESATVRARAYKEGYLDSPIVTASYTNLVWSQAGFLKTDDSTSGDWPGNYGSEGYLIPLVGGNQPQILQADFLNKSDWAWGEITDDSRALKRNRDDSSGVASCWYNENTLTVDISVLDTRSHAIALYFIDWDNAGREQKVDLYSGSNQLLQSFNVNQFQHGKYLVLNIVGLARVNITKIAGPNAVLSGIFMDPSPVPLGLPPKPAPLINEELVGSKYQFSIAGSAGQRLCVDFSPDLKVWIPVQTNTFTGSLMQVTNAPPPGVRGFYRARFLQ